jgi:hypothetical protein
MIYEAKRFLEVSSLFNTHLLDTLVFLELVIYLIQKHRVVDIGV